MIEQLTCVHGHGVWHWVVDAGMALPFVACGWCWLKSKFQMKEKQEKVSNES